ncbi:MAG: FAD-binding protein [Elusimicrobiaceae bacterium]|nr:FAD-binding protein [Elusimicrobiaceae bacterium]
MITVSAKCIGCAKCVKACPFGAIEMHGRKAVMNDKCTLCGACVETCPVKAISIGRSEMSRDTAGYSGVWVFAELSDVPGGGKTVRPVTLELLSAGKRLAGELGEELCAVLIGHDVAGHAAELAANGAQKVYLCDHKHAQHYTTDVYARVTVDFIRRHKPAIVLYPSTYIGRDIAPRISSELYVGLTADCTGLSIKEGNLLQTRPAFGGNIMADILSPGTRPQMATVRPNVMKRNEPEPGRQAEIIKSETVIDEQLLRVKVVERHVDHKQSGGKIDEAEVIVSGGRGMKNERGFKLLARLADELGGTVGASRAAVDMGLHRKTHQVGQSGTTVSPKLYVACGISGAVQHVVGMSGSDVIIAVNKDPNAPIFNICKYGLVGDAHQIVEKLTEALKAKK